MSAEVDKDAKLWGMLVHLSGLLGFTGIPFANIIAPIIVWQIKKETSPFVDEHGKEAVNFQINMIIYVIIGVITAFFCIGFVLLAVLGIVMIIMPIIAGLKANNGEPYRYPFIFRVIS